MRYQVWERRFCETLLPSSGANTNDKFYIKRPESEVAQSCPTLRDPVDCSPPGSSDHGILQARILEWVSISFPSPGDLPNPGIKPGSPALEADTLTSEPPGKQGSVKTICLQCWRPEFHPWVGKLPWRRAWQPTPIFLPGESPRTEEPGGLQSMGSQRVRPDWTAKHSTEGINR